MTAITEIGMIRLELRAACSQDVNRLLFEYVGADALNTATEEEMLGYIKSVAVKGTHKEVHRMKFFRLSQMYGETITQFVARIAIKNHTPYSVNLRSPSRTTHSQHS